MSLLPCIEIPTADRPDAAVIWLHGLGADGHDFAPIVPQLRLPAAAAIRFIFPHAPSRPVTINGGMVMPAWYDILAMNIDRRVDVAGLIASASEVRALVDREIERGIKAERIVVAGFSQGGAVAYQVVLGYPARLAGLLAMSTYLAGSDELHYSPANRDVPILVQHGLDDPLVPESVGRQAVNQLSGMGYAVSYQTYPMEHAVCPPQIDAISAWLQQVLP